MTDEEIVALFATKPTHAQLEKALNISHEGVDKWLKRRRAEGYKIVPVGRDGALRYELLGVVQ